MEPYLRCKTGRKLLILDPHFLESDVSAIAWSLAREARFSGQTYGFYSVGQHCLEMVKFLEEQGFGNLYLQVALLHDAAEAWLRDVPSPVKEVCPDYKALESKWQNAIYRDFIGVGIPQDVLYAVKMLDKDFRKAEQFLFQNKQMDNGPVPDHLKNWMPNGNWTGDNKQVHVKSAFIRKYDQLFRNIEAAHAATSIEAT